jgi:branched-subunit amino acid transport protein
MNEILLIAGMAAVTFGIRYSMLLLAGRFQFPVWLEGALHYVPPAVLAAIIVPAVLMPTGHIDLGYHNARLVGGLAAIMVGWFSQNLLLTIVLGMAAFWGWQWLLAGFM